MPVQVNAGRTSLPNKALCLKILKLDVIASKTVDGRATLLWSRCKQLSVFRWGQPCCFKSRRAPHAHLEIDGLRLANPPRGTGVTCCLASATQRPWSPHVGMFKGTA